MTTKEQKIPAQDIYQQLYSSLKVNPRTVQWYASEGYIPKPEKIGTEAFYSPEAQVATRVRIIHSLQKRFGMRLKEIKEIVEKQAESDWEEIYNLLSAMEELFPYYEIDDFGHEYIDDRGGGIAKIILQRLRTSPISQGWLSDAQEEYEQQSESTSPGPDY